MGVSYRLLAIFMLAPELEGRRTRAVFYFGTSALAVAILGGAVAIRLGMELDLVLSLAAALGIVALALYGAAIVYLYRARKRRNIERSEERRVGKEGVSTCSSGWAQDY